MHEEHDITSISRLYKEYKDRFIYFARTYIFDKETAEDIVMESFLYYLEKRDELHDNNIPSYILSVVKNKCLNYLTRLRKQQEIGKHLMEMESWELNLQISSLEACDPDALFSAEIRAIIKTTLAGFPEQTREIFIRSRFNNESHKEIALRMNLSTKSVEYHITKVLKVLRVALKDYFQYIIYFHFLFK